MRDTIVATSIVMLLLICHRAGSQPDSGTVLFDCPDVPSPEFQFDLNRRVIALVMEDPAANMVPLFNSIANLHLRNYRGRFSNFKKMVQYYGTALKARGWHALGQNLQSDNEIDNFHLYTLRHNETVRGIFIIVKSSEGVYLINIVGEIPRKQLGELLLNLDQLGIEIPELMSLRPRDLELAPPTPIAPLPKPVKPTPEPPAPPDTDPRTKPPAQTIPEPTKPWNWSVGGKPIHDIQIQYTLTTSDSTDPKRIQDTMTAERANIMKILENGSGDITAVMPVLASVLLNSSRKVSLHVTEEGARRIAIITVTELPATRKISILKSLTISGPRGNQVHISTYDKLIPQEAGAEASLAATRFWAKDTPIHEIRIRGNQKISEARIRRTLENGSEDIEQALRTLFKVMPYFKEINLQVDEEEAKYIAIITVDEKPLSTNTYLGLSPMLRFGFNRVTGWEIGTGFEVGKRKEVGPLWRWNIGNPERNQTSKLFGKVSYAFGNPHVHYRLGGTANWGKPHIWNLGITAQIHRATDVIAPELFPGYNAGIFTLFRVLGGPDYPNYYLREGVEVALRWEPVLPTHSFKLAMVAESHDNLQKSTDWSIANWTSRRVLRKNPLINPGSMRSFIFQYDFNTRKSYLGWHNTLFVEHSNSAFGSDFDFTRYQLHLRYAYPLGKHRFHTRFLFGFSNVTLPIQRQFVISGPGGLRGYPLFAPVNEAEREATTSWYRYSRYAFAGDRGFLFNIEYHYCLAAITDWAIFENVFAIVFLDEGQVWKALDAKYTFDPSGNIGIGLQLGSGDVIYRINIAKALNFNIYTKERLLTEPAFVITSTWYHNF